MIWGAFCNRTLGPCYIIDKSINSNVYIEEILMPFYSNFYLNHVECQPGKNFYYQQDNAPAHTSAKTKSWLTQKNIPLLYWPPQSPDQNPIEHLWEVMQKQRNSRSPLPKNLPELKVALLEEWQKIPQETSENLVNSVPRRLEALKMANGWNTKY